MGEEEEKGFQVRDRRAYLKDTDREKASEKVRDQKPAPTPPGQEEHSHPSAEASFPVHFSSFILSLATSALIHLGQEANPATGERSVELPSARQVIDLITLLEEKTKGNLTPEEENLLKQILFTLRLKFVEVEKKRHP
jgi:DNA replication initiation complex subunit (GINS family)